MHFLATSNEIEKNIFTKQLFEYLKRITVGRKGFGYYKFPVAGGKVEEIPDIVIIDAELGICAIDVCEYNLDQIDSIDEDIWSIENQDIDSPHLRLQDYIVSLEYKYKEQRVLRNKVKINTVLVLPLVSKVAFEGKFPEANLDNIVFNDYLEIDYKNYWGEFSKFSSEESELFLAVSQGAGPMNDFKKIYTGDKVDRIGEAVKLISYKIKSLDIMQHAAAIQIPDGPQRIRGMAGTGKTIILTMKAAFLHARYPDKKILYTFHTQALYNQVRDLITLFFREDKKVDPDWNKLLIRHSWGTKYKEGVYTRTCVRNSINQLGFQRNLDNPLDYIFSDLLKHELEEEYDYVLIDEAQDFPPSFYKVIYRTTKSPKRIIFAYDELQSLEHVETLDINDLFGLTSDGRPLVDFSPGTYGNDIEMDYVLERSYRNPLEILMLAHGIGLGLYNPTGIMQVIEEKRIWESIGYKILAGNCKTNDAMAICRPKENSVSVVHEFYKGKIDTIRYSKYSDRNEEIDFIVKDIAKMVNREGVLPHHIVVITLGNLNMKENFSRMQKLLYDKGISSIIPGIDVDRDEFGVENSVTLSTVYKAKGNEAFVVYVMGFDHLYDYVDFVETRNRAFTSISRSKGWVVITGIGSNMTRGIKEIETILADVNKDATFRFTFPKEENIARKLSSEEHARRLQTQKVGKEAINHLLGIDDNFINNLPDDVKEKLIEKLGGQK
jgi:superfamily I DNA and RNA helicase